MTERIVFVGDPKRPARLTEDPCSVEDNPTLTFFLNYWRSKRENVLPLRNTFVPKEIRGHLQWILTVDPLPGSEDFRYRVIGSRITEYFLGDATGKTVREAFKLVPELGAGFIELFRLSAQLRLPVRLDGPSSRYDKIFYPSYDCLYLPYSSDGVTTDRLVCAFTFNRQSMSTRWPVTLASQRTELT